MRYQYRGILALIALGAVTGCVDLEEQLVSGVS